MKKYKNNIEVLNTAIFILEERKKQEYNDLKLQFYETSENFRPINIFKQSVKDFTEIGEVRTNLFETLLSITGGYFSKKIIIGKSNSIIKNIFGYALQYTVTNFIAKKVSTESEE
jgi:hypothetical protein